MQKMETKWCLLLSQPRGREVLEGWDEETILALSQKDRDYLYQYALEATGGCSHRDRKLHSEEEMKQIWRDRQRAYRSHKIGVELVSIETLPDAIDDLDPEKIMLIKERSKLKNRNRS